ncbi:hypothetical protein [Sneathiella chinensis]|uniref:DUF3311 domain-containing protein n=1 Tax=Sneathiella chinensis TaxID=349750 RepID=A0ABQ5U2I9_9PROT|nr:hypothetical protein [Sneathiella chinensis]GLQ06119.1 hypothetical protein GCM10007924_13400 [Sneathiella chinensis]
MKRSGRKKEWSILLFSFFLLGIVPPVIIVFDKQSLFLGFPLSFLFLYGLWAVVILFMAIGARKRLPGPDQPDRANLPLFGRGERPAGRPEDATDV